MSADNGVYILKTTSEWQIDKESGSKFSDHSDRPVWRVAEFQGISNLYWYKEQQPYNFGAFMLENWGRSQVYYTEAEAFEKAKEIYKKTMEDFGVCEHGIQTIDMENYRFFGD